MVQGSVLISQEGEAVISSICSGKPSSYHKHRQKVSRLSSPVQIANNTFLAVDSPTSMTLIGAVHRFARIRDHLGFDEFARQSEANYAL